MNFLYRIFVKLKSQTFIFTNLNAIVHILRLSIVNSRTQTQNLAIKISFSFLACFIFLFYLCKLKEKCHFGPNYTHNGNKRQN
jgi:hypothetical protein